MHDKPQQNIDKKGENAGHLPHVIVVGGGAWGTALAQTIATAKHCKQIQLVTRSAEQARLLNSTRENQQYLPGLKLHSALQAISETINLRLADVLVLAVPGQKLRKCLEEIGSEIAPSAKIILAIKGLEEHTHLRMSEIVAEILPNHEVAVLSGPSFAHEVMRGLPCSLVIAAGNLADAAGLLPIFTTDTMRLYPSSDILGAELGGTVKNVLAIACGLAAAMQLGENARAALITRGLAEMVRLGEALGADRQTLYGLSGMGDLVLTCGGTTSRNYRFGLALGQGQKAGEAEQNIGTVEGLHSARSLVALAEKSDIEMPICTAVLAIICEKLSPQEAVHKLLTRDIRQDGE